MDLPVQSQRAQLDDLRKRMAEVALRTDLKMAVRPEPVERGDIAAHVSGEVIKTPAGFHFESERAWTRHRRHGTMCVSDLAGLPHDLLDGISGGELPSAAPEEWAFLDTETTGLAGGSGTCAFLVGIGRITPDGFRVRQYFMRDHGEEPSQLHAINDALDGAKVLVTYNGKSFDVPLLETRFRMARMKPPFSRIGHLDLLHGARRLWRLRFESCRLVELESRVLGHQREDDVPGDLIPFLYFDYLRTGRAERLGAVFLHNALDIVSLACLTGIVPWAFKDDWAGWRPSHGAEMVSLARWLRQEGRLEQARDLFRQGIARTLPDSLLFRSMWDLAGVEKKLGNRDGALALLTDLASCRNPHRAEAFEELAKHYEHREKNYAMALEFTESALAITADEGLVRRRERLLRLAAVPRYAGRLV